MEEYQSTREVRERVDCDRRFQGEQEPQRKLDVRTEYDKPSEHEGQNRDRRERLLQFTGGQMRLERSKPYWHDSSDVRAHPCEGQRFFDIVKGEEDRNEPHYGTPRQLATSFETLSGHLTLELSCERYQ